MKCTICETACPVSNVTPLFPGPKYAGPQAERYRVADEPSVDDVGRLLLGLRHLHAGLPAGREDRRDQRPGAQQAQAPEGRPAARPHHHPPDVARARWGRRRRRSPTGRSTTRPLRDPGREAAQRPPRRAARPTSPGGASRAGRASTRARRPGARSSTSTAAAPSTTSREEGEKLVAILEHNGFEVEVPKQDCCGLPLQSNGLFDDARKVVLRLARNLAPHVRDDDTIIVGNATSCTLMLKREAREILDLEDDPDLELVSRAHLRHLRAAARAARPRRAQDRLPAASRTRSPTTRRASSRATGSASRRSSCWR